VSGDLIVHAHRNVVAFVSHDAFRTKLLPKFSRQLGVAGKKPRFQHRSLRAHVAVRLGNGFFN
jgi:hypothetical protein